MRTLLVLPLLVGGFALAGAGWAFAGDAAKGHDIAAERCARCHDIEKGGAFKQHPPSFQAIAIYRAEPDIWSRIIAPSPHSGMPEVVWEISPDDVQNLLAYITSLDVPLPQ